MLDHATKNGPIAASDSPGTLALVTGSPLNSYRPLNPGDEHYEAFRYAWGVQDSWDRATYFAYWRLALAVWPVAAGPTKRYEHLSWWVWSWRRSGLTDQEIADRLGWPLDTLRRKGALKRADEHAAALAATPVAERLWVRVPRIVAVDHEQVPGQMETWYDPRLSACWPEKVRVLREHLDTITSGGPRASGNGQAS